MSDETFLSRWSRRKAEQPSAHAAETEVQHESLSEQDSLALASISDDITGEISAAAGNSGNNAENGEPIPLTDADMPTIESLSEESDYSQFLSAGISDELRNLALRKLFNLPQFNIVDGLNDYDEDFSKMPALSQEVVARMRSWMQDKQEQVVDEIRGDITGDNCTGISQESIAESTDQFEQNPAQEPTGISSTTEDIDEEDPLGHADLEG